jgi:ureidoglycolate dehydrogenase (NAD+)
MANGDVRVDPEPLKEFTREVFTRLGVPPEDAATEAEVLLWANLRGVDSHGVLRIRNYMGSLESGMMNATPNIQVENETPATVLIEADRALGPVVTTAAMRMVVRKAGEVGVGWGLIRNTTHQGAMGYYSLMAAKEGMAGIAIVCSPPNMAPFGARTAGLHNSPISIAVPGKNLGPLILDMATSVAAGGKVQLAVDKGVPIPVGWALDKDGNSTTDPNMYATLLPFGGPKGSGLSLMFECLSSLMVGNPLLQPTLEGKEDAPRGVQNSVIAAIDIGTFTNVEEYKEHVDGVIEGLKSLPRADGVDEIFVPGEPEDRVYQDRVKNGIPLPEGTIENLRYVANRLEVDLSFLN